MAIVDMRVLAVFLFCFFLSIPSASEAAGNFYDDTDITWGDHRAKILEGGKLLTLSLDEASGSGFQSKREYLFGRFDMKIKLVSGNSAGTVTAYYLSSEGPNHDEVDSEFLGNLSGQPYIVHTNVYTQAEVPGSNSFIFGLIQPKIFTLILYYGTLKTSSSWWMTSPLESSTTMKPEVFPSLTESMKLYASLWSADQWTTRGGLDKTSWTCAPFTASFRDFNEPVTRLIPHLPVLLIWFTSLTVVDSSKG